MAVKLAPQTPQQMWDFSLLTCVLELSSICDRAVLGLRWVFCTLHSAGSRRVYEGALASIIDICTYLSGCSTVTSFRLRENLA
jgi:hypothetical protein